MILGATISLVAPPGGEHELQETDGHSANTSHSPSDIHMIHTISTLKSLQIHLYVSFYMRSML